MKTFVMWLENQGFIDYVNSLQGQEFDPKDVLKQWTVQQKAVIKAQKAAQKAAQKSVPKGRKAPVAIPAPATSPTCKTWSEL